MMLRQGGRLTTPLLATASKALISRSAGSLVGKDLSAGYASPSTPPQPQHPLEMAVAFLQEMSPSKSNSLPKQHYHLPFVGHTCSQTLLATHTLPLCSRVVKLF